MIPSNILHGGSVRLTALTPNDLPTIARWYQNADFLRLFDARPAYPKTETALAQWLEERHKMYEKLGFQREGVYRESIQRDGRRYDTYLYGLLRREWEVNG